MGCLIEFFIEIFVEGVFELIGYCYIKLMQMIVPNKVVSEQTKIIIRNAVTTIAVILGVVLIVGLILFVQDDPYIKLIGKYMTYIPLALMILQVIVGLIVKLVNHFR